MVRKARFVKVRARAARLDRLRPAAGQRSARTIFATGLLPALAYGAEIICFSDVELRAATAIGLRYVSPGNPGSSRPARLLLSDGAGVDKVACAAFIRFSHEIDVAAPTGFALPSGRGGCMGCFRRIQRHVAQRSWADSRG